MILLNTTMTMGGVLLISLISILIVFAALIILSLAFSLIGKLSVKSSKKRMQKAGHDEMAISSSEIPASEIAAISMALHLYLDDVHDKESNVLTIKRIERRYSPWNSKIYGLTNLNK